MASKCSLPSVVFCIEKEVGTDDGNTDCNNAQDHQHQHHKSIHIVNLVGPERCEDEVPEGRWEEVFNLIFIVVMGININPEPMYRLTSQWILTRMEGCHLDTQ